RLSTHRASRPVRRRVAQRRPGRHATRARAGGRATSLRMIDTAEQQHAALALRLLLDQDGSPAGTTIDWRLLLALAERNTVLVRLATRLDQAALQPPAFFTTAV